MTTSLPDINPVSVRLMVSSGYKFPCATVLVRVYIVTAVKAEVLVVATVIRSFSLNHTAGSRVSAVRFVVFNVFHVPPYPLPVSI